MKRKLSAVRVMVIGWALLAATAAPALAQGAIVAPKVCGEYEGVVTCAHYVETPSGNLNYHATQTKPFEEGKYKTKIHEHHN